MATAHEVIAYTGLNIRKIGVLTDFSKTADAALKYAAALARDCQASLVLAHAYLPPASAYAAPDAALVYQAFDDLRKDLENRLLREIETLHLRDLKCSAMLCEGVPKDLLKCLDGVDLIVVGTSGEAGLEKAVLGSTAETIFRCSQTPVLTVGPRCSGSGAMATMGPVLYATDLSSGAAAALPYAFFMAREMAARLMLLHVVDEKDINFSFERAMATAEPLEALQQLVPDNIELKGRPECVIGFGSPGVVILEEARKHQARMIVMTVRGGTLTPIASRLSEGTAYKVAANAACPVLTVRHA